MKYLVREMREVVVINNLPHIIKHQETFEVLEEGLTTQSSLKAGFEPDTLVRKNNGEILLLRDEDRGETIFNKEDIMFQKLTIIKDTNDEVFDYYNMILNKMVSYERDARIDSLLDKEEVH